MPLYGYKLVTLVDHNIVPVSGWRNNPVIGPKRTGFCSGRSALGPLADEFVDVVGVDSVLKKPVFPRRDDAT